MATQPKVLLLDEPSAGLSPVLVDRVLAAVVRLRELKPLIELLTAQNPLGAASAAQAFGA